MQEGELELIDRLVELELARAIDPGARELRRRYEDQVRSRMMERIQQKIGAAPEQSFFFAVGAAHMPDRRGVVRLLEDQGFTVTRLPESAEYCVR